MVVSAAMRPAYSVLLCGGEFRVAGTSRCVHVGLRYRTTDSGVNSLNASMKSLAVPKSCSLEGDDILQRFTEM